jgi:apolipoprotein N-acyltransferase
VFGEPSTYAAVMSPAMFIALHNLVMFKTYIYKRWQSVLVLGVYLFTFSSLGYLWVFIAIILLMVNFGVIRYFFIFLPILIGGFYYLYETVPDFRYRLDSTITLFSTGKIDIREEHGSSIVFYNNYSVAMQNFRTNFLFGTGLGSHPVAFEKYSLTKDIVTFGFANNSADANSMMLRVISEIGLVGIVMTFVFLSRGFVKRDRNSPEHEHWLISSATLCVMLLYLLRQGHYFLNGFPLFVWMYWYNKQNHITAVEEKRMQATEHVDPEVNEK